MGAINDLTNRRFGRLLVKERFKHPTKRVTLYKCVCDCGNEVVVRHGQLTTGETKSCGCLRKEMLSQKQLTHGHSKEKLYLVWKSMRKRCNNPNDKSYKYYGAKGTKVCDEWEKDYLAFRNWAYNNGYFEMETYNRNTIDRINPYGNYCPENCRIADWFIQNQNKRR